MAFEIAPPFFPTFRIESWFIGKPVVIAGANHIRVAVAAFEAALNEYPNREITLRQGACVIRHRDAQPDMRGPASS
jgi:hypothetical protein